LVCAMKKKHSTMSVTSTDIPQANTSISYPVSPSPYYTTTTISPSYPPHWMEKEYHEYIAHKGQFEKFRQLREEFQKYLDNKLAFEEYMTEAQKAEPIPTTIDF
jgi:hypothetical protein